MNSERKSHLLSPFKECRKYEIPLWQCPPFIFSLLGVIIICFLLLTYFISRYYIGDPHLVALMVLIVAGVLYVLDFIIVKSFENLAQANRMKSEFIDIVSHQLRAPLSNLNWAIDFLSSQRIESLSEKQKEYLGIVQENVGRMRELIGDLLVVSRLETGKLPLEKEKFSINQTIKKVVSEFNSFIKASNVEVELNLAPDLPLAVADSSKIKSVIENLLDNAIRYIEESGRVTIRTSSLDHKIRFEVEDTGVGIPKSEHNYVFKKFFRAKSALRNQTRGSGLGLYICKSIIQRSGGNIGFSSEPSKGSTFWFTLPTK